MLKYLTDPKVLSDEVVDEFLAAHKRVPDAEFAIVSEWAIAATADFVLTRENPETGKKEFLLAWRTQEPFQDTWFVPGGVFKSGTSREGCLVNLKRELGVEGVEPRFVGEQFVINPPGPGRPAIWRSLWHLYEVPVPQDIELKLNAENAKFQWFDRIQPDFPDPVKAALVMMGFTE